MVHKKEDEDLLNSLSMDDKLKQVSTDWLAKSKTLIKMFRFWDLSRNKYPHDDRWEQVIAWLKPVWNRLLNRKRLMTPNKQAHKELREVQEFVTDLLGTYDYWTVRNSKADRSIENYHIHFFTK